MDAKGFLGNRRDRAAATILGYKDQKCDSYLPPDVSAGLRKVILDQLNDLCELAFDLLDADTVVNEIFLERLDAIYEKVSDATP